MPANMPTKPMLDRQPLNDTARASVVAEAIALVDAARDMTSKASCSNSRSAPARGWR
jgi:hypothetical protein